MTDEHGSDSPHLTKRSLRIINPPRLTYGPTTIRRSMILLMQAPLVRKPAYLKKRPAPAKKAQCKQPLRLAPCFPYLPASAEFF